MLFSKRSAEGYVRVDHRDSPGFTAEEIAKGARTVLDGHIGPGEMFEGATKCCHRCSRHVIMNPDRSRARSWCSKHDAYECDGCAAERARTGECISMQERIDQFLEHATKGA